MLAYLKAMISCGDAPRIALGKISPQKPDLVVDHVGELVDLASRDQVPMVKMHLVMIFGHLAVYE
jgi:hypothetical protein